jgi:hypothetical protein
LLACTPAWASSQSPISISRWLQGVPLETPPGELQPILQQEGSYRGEDYFRTPSQGKRYLEPVEEPVDWFEETFRIGVNSGLIFPLIARQADYHIGWWARAYGQFGWDVGLSLFRTSVEVSLGVGQSLSSRAQQPYRITSNYTFFSARGILDFLPDLPADLFIFAGAGLGFEFASGHVVRASGTVEETKTTNFNLLMESGAGYALELAHGFYLEMRGTITYPLGSPNVTFFVLGELGVQFLFQ